MNKSMVATARVMTVLLVFVLEAPIPPLKGFFFFNKELVIYSQVCK